MEANARMWLGRLSRSPFIFPLAAIAAVLLLTLSEVAYRRASADVDTLRVQVEVRADVQSALLCVAQVESEEQRYLRTGRAHERMHHPACQKGIDGPLARAQQALAAQPEVQHDVARLRQMVQRRLAWVPAAVRQGMPGSDPLDPPTGLQAGSETGPPPVELADAIHDLSMHIVAGQTQSLERVRRDLREVLWLHRVGIAGMVAMSLLAVAVVLRQTSALARQREEQRRAVLAERDHLEQQVRARTEELTELTAHLEWAAEEARARLASALHDEMGALLTAAKLDAARLKARLGSADVDVAKRLAHLTGALNQVITMKRRLIEELRPSSLQHLGLVPALEGLLEEVRRRTGLEMEAALVRVPLAPDVALTVYRLVQEALENVERHAAARRVWVRLRLEDPGMARIEVQDDGRGFDLGEHRAAWHGLVGLRYRVQGAQGRWLLDSRVGQGTCVGAVLPLVSQGAPGSS